VKKRVGNDGKINIIDRVIPELNSKYVKELSLNIQRHLETQTSDIYEMYTRSGVQFAWPYSLKFWVSYVECFLDIKVKRYLNLDFWNLYMKILETYGSCNISIGELDKTGLLSVRVDLGNGVKLIAYRKTADLIRIELRFFKDYFKNMVISYHSDKQVFYYLQLCQREAVRVINQVFEMKTNEIILSKKLVLKEFNKICGSKNAEEIMDRIIRNNGVLKVKARIEPGVYKNSLKLREAGILKGAGRSRYRLTDEYLKALVPYFIDKQFIKLFKLHMNRRSKKC